MARPQRSLRIRELADCVHAAFRSSLKRLTITEHWLFSRQVDSRLSDDELEVLYSELLQLLELLERFNKKPGGGGKPPPQNELGQGQGGKVR